MIVFITGATDGLGRALAGQLAADGHQLILHGRDEAKLADTATGIRDAHGVEVRTALADLAELAQVRKLAADVRAMTDRLDVFVSNAGIGGEQPRQTSLDGHELRFAVNYLAGFLLTLELLPLLRASAPARIVNVASLGQQSLDFDDLMIERGYSAMRAYRQSKLAQVMSGFELAARLDGVTVNSLHPGTYMPTKMVLPELGYSVDTLETGVETTARLAVGTEIEGVTGRFFDRLREARADEQAYDTAARRELWRRSLALVDHPDIG
jgi:NAD(P)-dependent dehydrogenase (short-subunit alcohol dehydrogenase family)